ncbi:hypothetical protein TrispH2_011872, partial [Trichoplax sp. H2]
CSCKLDNLRNRKLTMAFNYIQIYELGLLKSHKMVRAIRSLLTLSKDGEEQTGTVWSNSLFFFCKEFKSE